MQRPDGRTRKPRSSGPADGQNGGYGWVFVVTKRKGSANGIAAAGSGLGSLIYSPTSETIIQNLGQEWCFRTTAICASVVNTVCMLLMRDRNKELVPNQRAFDLKVFKRCESLVIIG